MSRNISKAESWERVYDAFQQVNFTAFDYNTVKASLVEYMKIYHPENFNDYIESSEFVAMLELFAYIAEQLAYRIDMNAHENFLSTAQRKQSVLRLATLLSYNPSRNIPARALIKITSIKSTEAVYDSRGINLANKKILWNDPNNTDWKEQFLLVMNRIMQQEFGTVAPSDRVQVDNVLFELYTLNNTALTNGVLTYSVSSNGKTYPMELVPSILTDNGPKERRPGLGTSFSILYGSDGLGDSSDTTGFFMFTKQGTLAKTTKSFDGITPNQTTDIPTKNINETDVWVNQIDPNTGQLVTSVNIDPLGRNLGSQGQWTQITNQGVSNVIFNNDLNRNKYQIETLEDDKIRFVFGDGEFADIPSGTFDMWYRSSANENAVITRSSINGKTGALAYTDSVGSNQNFTFTFSAINTITNASASEDIERVRRSASDVYYTQDRMVNKVDYNVYPTQDPSILKIRAINRTFSGDSKYIFWHDPSEHYEDVKIFGNDLVYFFDEDNIQISVPNNTNIDVVIKEHIQPLLTDSAVLSYHLVNNIPLPSRVFSATEVALISEQYNTAVINNSLPLSLVYEFNGVKNTWIPYADDGSLPVAAVVTFTIDFDTSTSIWDVRYNAVLSIIESPTTRFWHHNNSVRTVVDDTLDSRYDTVTILQANTNSNRDGVLDSDIATVVVGGVTQKVSPNIGQPYINRLYVAAPDTNQDGIPDDLLLDQLLDQRVLEPVAFGVINLPFDYLIDLSMLEIRALDGDGNLIRKMDIFSEYQEYASGTQIADQLSATTYAKTSSNQIFIVSVPYTVGSPSVIATTLEIVKNDYVYFERASATTGTVLKYAGSTDSDAGEWYDDPLRDNEIDGDHVRYRGRDKLNFFWSHVTPRGQLIDPATTNINDMFVITRGYYTAMLDWLNGISEKPSIPTPLSLRNDYAHLIDARMLSDTVIMHPGRFKILFGKDASVELQAKIKVVRSSSSLKTDNEIKVIIVDVIKRFFDIDLWEFGETFNFTELGSQIHTSLVNEISTVVLVPTLSQNQFGDLFQIVPQEDELFLPSISVDDIEIVEFLNPQNLRQSS